MKRIGLDIRGTVPGFRAHFGRGTGRYATELSKRLILPSQDEIQVDGLTAELLRGEAWESALLNLLPAGKQTAHTQWILPRRLGRLPFELLHFVHHGDATARSPVPYCVTVLDLIPLRFPDLYKPKRASWRFRLARKLELDSIHNACGIFAISEATKRDIIDILGIPQERIVVTPLGVDEKFSPRENDWQNASESLKSELELPLHRPLLFYFGGIDPRKNVPFLFEMFRALVDEWKGERPVLALAGNYTKDERYPLLLKERDRLGLADDIKMLGFVSEEKLQGLLRASDLLLFPSLYEGFGLPVLEAMACGVPVLAGKNSSLIEVMGRDEYLLPDKDVRAWKNAALSLLGDSHSLMERSAWGLSRVPLFSWEKTAELTREGYKAFVDAPRFSQGGYLPRDLRAQLGDKGAPL